MSDRRFVDEKLAPNSIVEIFPAESPDQTIAVLHNGGEVAIVDEWFSTAAPGMNHTEEVQRMIDETGFEYRIIRNGSHSEQ